MLNFNLTFYFILLHLKLIEAFSSKNMSKIFERIESGKVHGHLFSIFSRLLATHEDSLQPKNLHCWPPFHSRRRRRRRCRRCCRCRC